MLHEALGYQTCALGDNKSHTTKIYNFGPSSFLLALMRCPKNENILTASKVELCSLRDAQPINSWSGVIILSSIPSEPFGVKTLSVRFLFTWLKRNLEQVIPLYHRTVTI